MGIYTMNRNVKISFYIIVCSPMVFSLYIKASKGYVPASFLTFCVLCREEMCLPQRYEMEIIVFSAQLGLPVTNIYVKRK